MSSGNKRGINLDQLAAHYAKKFFEKHSRDEVREFREHELAAVIAAALEASKDTIRGDVSPLLPQKKVKTGEK